MLHLSGIGNHVVFFCIFLDPRADTPPNCFPVTVRVNYFGCMSIERSTIFQTFSCCDKVIEDGRYIIPPIELLSIDHLDIPLFNLPANYKAHIPTNPPPL